MIHYLGIFVLIYALMITTPVLVAVTFSETMPLSWLYCLSAYIVIGFVCALSKVRMLHFRSSISLVLLSWLLISLMAAVPLWCDPHVSLSFSQAWFESTSGLTTTGASVVSQIASWPHYLIYYHQLLQFIGGLGVLIFVMTILPMVGSGSLMVYKSQVQGSVIDEKFMPRFHDIARWLIGIYVGLGVCAWLCYLAVGLSIFDSLCLMFSTVSTGGFAFKHELLMQTGAQGVSIVLMMMAAISFKLHFLAFKTRSWSGYLHNDECRQWLIMVLSVCVFVWFDYETTATTQSFLPSVFQIVSLLSSTGYMLQADWNMGSLPLVLLIVLGYVGGCSGSTSSGIKWVRVSVIRQVVVEAMQGILYPHQVHGYQSRRRVIPHVLAYVVLLFITGLLVSFIFYASGSAMGESMGAAMALCTNLGATIHVDFSQFNDSQNLVGVWAMLVGRVECISFYILFMRQFWWR